MDFSKAIPAYFTYAIIRYGIKFILAVSFLIVSTIAAVIGRKAYDKKKNKHKDIAVDGSVK